MRGRPRANRTGPAKVLSRMRKPGPKQGEVNTTSKRTNSGITTGHVRNLNILTWLRGFKVKLLYLMLLSLYASLVWEMRDKKLEKFKILTPAKAS